MDFIPWDTLSRISPLGFILVLTLQLVIGISQYRNQHVNPDFRTHFDKVEDILTRIEASGQANSRRLEDIWAEVKK